MKTKIVGLDISSKTIGWSLLEYDDSTKAIKYLDSGYIKPKKDPNILNSLISTREQILDLFTKMNPDVICIEDLVKAMRGTNTVTISVLASFNRMIGLLAYDFNQKLPELCNIMSIRHGIKLNKQLPPKEDIPDLVAKHLGITFPYEYTSKGRGKNKKNVPIVENYDRADGIAVALYYALKLRGKKTK